MASAYIQKNNDYTITYNGLTVSNNPDKQVVGAKLTIYDGGKSVGGMTPKKIFHRSYEQPVSEVAIRSINLAQFIPKEDLYINLAGWTEDQTATLQVQVNPLVQWIWIGGGVFLAGALLALAAQRRHDGNRGLS